MKVVDVLEGNEAGQECRERYREIVKALGEDGGKFVARFEVKLLEGGGCVLIATSSRGAECDIELSKLAILMIQGMTGVTSRPNDEDDDDGEDCSACSDPSMIMTDEEIMELSRARVAILTAARAWDASIDWASYDDDTDLLGFEERNLHKAMQAYQALCTPADRNTEDPCQ